MKGAQTDKPRQNKRAHPAPHKFTGISDRSLLLLLFVRHVQPDIRSEDLGKIQRKSTRKKFALNRRGYVLMLEVNKSHFGTDASHCVEKDGQTSINGRKIARMKNNLVGPQGQRQRHP